MKLKVVIRLVHTALTPATRLKWRRPSFHLACGQAGSMGMEGELLERGGRLQAGCFQVRSKGVHTHLLYEHFKPSAHSGAWTVQPMVKYNA